MGSSLTTGEKRKLKTLEETIEKGLQSFVDVGTALAAIRDEKLYSDVGETFEEYCKKRWQLGKSQAYRYIEAAHVVEILSPMGDIPPPTNERQVRPLTELETEQEQATAWTKAVETAPTDKDGKPKVTAAHVAAVVAEMKGEPADDEPEEESSEPTVPERMAEWNRNVDAFARKITAILAEAPSGEYMDETRLGIISDTLKSAAASARQAKGYAECTYCEGAGCKKCRGTGWLTKVDYDSSPGAVA